jgi:hypothetical protein
MTNSELIKDVQVTVLTGSRPHLLKQTLEYLPEILFENMFILLNGNDQESKDVIYEFPVDFDYTDKMLYIGQSVSKIAEYVQSTNKKYWLHIEDDWKYVSDNLDWLYQAQTLLKENPEFSQIRLRHISEKVLPYSQVTKKPIEWKNHKWGKFGEAHYTHNPSLLRVADIDCFFPEHYERQAQTNAYNNGKRIIFQLNPGCFFHMGEGEKSLKRTRMDVYKKLKKEHQI